MVQVQIVLVGGARVPLELEDAVLQVGVLKARIADSLSRPVTSFKVVHKGTTMPDDEQARVKLGEGDVLLVMPQRKAPPARLVSAALQAGAGAAGRRGGADDEEEEEPDAPAQLPGGAPGWERWLVEALRRRRLCAPWVMEWVILIRPHRLVLLLAFMLGCVIANRFSLGPVFILLTLIYVMVTNLGKRREGELSSYSIFNPGVQRLPGQLDADDIDRQIRQGQMVGG